MSYNKSQRQRRGVGEKKERVFGGGKYVKDGYLGMSSAPLPLSRDDCIRDAIGASPCGRLQFLLQIYRHTCK